MELLLRYTLNTTKHEAPRSQFKDLLRNIFKLCRDAFYGVKDLNARSSSR